MVEASVPEPVRDYPDPAPAVGRVEPVPRRLRGRVGPTWVFDTDRARYVWEHRRYPAYYVPLDDVDPAVVVPGTGAADGGDISLRVGEDLRVDAGRLVGAEGPADLADHVRFRWDALDAWFEEDEPIAVHPRDPYVRVDVQRSSRPLRVELDGVVLAESAAPLLLFETGLPTRYYVDAAALRLEHLTPSDTVTACPYKGTTTQYWSATVGERHVPDIAWSYGAPRREVLPIAGLVAFYNERVDLLLDGRRLPRPIVRR